MENTKKKRIAGFFQFLFFSEFLKSNKADYPEDCGNDDDNDGDNGRE